MEQETQNDAIARRIRAARAVKGYNQSEMARQLGVDRSNYNRLESRAEKLSIEMLTRIAKTLDVELLSLLTDIPIPIHANWGRFGVTFPEPIPMSKLLGSQRNAVPDDSTLVYRKQITDKEEIITGFQNSRQILIRQVELGLLRTASALRLEAVSNSEMGEIHMKSYLNFHIPPLYDFPYADEQQSLLDRTYSGFQFMFLIAYVNLTEGNFSNLVTRCIESYIIPHNTLYARAFLHLRNAKETIVGRDGSDLLRHQWMIQDQQEHTDPASPSAPKNSSESDGT